MRNLLICSIFLLLLPTAPAQEKTDETKWVEALRAGIWPKYKLMGRPEWSHLEGGLKVCSIRFEHVEWQSKNQSQGFPIVVGPDGKRRVDMPDPTVEPPEGEKAGYNRLVDSAEFWFVSAGKRSEQRLSEADLGLEVRENRWPLRYFYLGQAGGWHAYARANLGIVLSTWKKGNYHKGDDPVEASLDGLAVRDNNNMTLGVALDFLRKEGPSNLAALQRSLERGNPSRQEILGVAASWENPEADAWLLKMAGGDGELSTKATYALMRPPRPKAEIHYINICRKFLNEHKADYSIYEALQCLKSVGSGAYLGLAKEASEKAGTFHDYAYFQKLIYREEKGELPRDVMSAIERIQKACYGRPRGPQLEIIKVETEWLAGLSDREVVRMAALRLLSEGGKGMATAAIRSGLRLVAGESEDEMRGWIRTTQAQYPGDTSFTHNMSIGLVAEYN